MNVWDKEKIDRIFELLEQGQAYDTIGKEFNVSGSRIRKLLQIRGYTLPKRRVINPKETFNRKKRNLRVCKGCGRIYSPSYPDQEYCSISCGSYDRSWFSYMKILKGDPDIYRPNYTLKSVKRFILDEQDHKCAICGMPEIWNNKPLVFIIDHIDGNAANNYRLNLRCICPNCDSQLDTYKSKNKNSARYYYRYGKLRGNRT